MLVVVPITLVTDRIASALVDVRLVRICAARKLLVDAAVEALRQRIKALMSEAFVRPGTAVRSISPGVPLRAASAGERELPSPKAEGYPDTLMLMRPPSS